MTISEKPREKADGKFSGLPWPGRHGAARKPDLPRRRQRRGRPHTRVPLLLGQTTGGIGFALNGDRFSGYLEVAQPFTRPDLEGRNSSTLFAELSYRL